MVHKRLSSHFGSFTLAQYGLLCRITVPTFLGIAVTPPKDSKSVMSYLASAHSPLSQPHNNTYQMCGFSIVAIGYEVADALEGYQRQHNIEGVLPFKQLLQC